MGSKKEYRMANSQFLRDIARKPGVTRLPEGVFYEVINEGEGTLCPSLSSVVVVNYKGELTNGHQFDSSYEDPCPTAFRLRDLVPGWQIALQQMHKGDKWKIYIPAEHGYGTRAVDDIPGNSTLIFEIELVDIQ